jgi:hypothetical protein
MLTVIWQGRTHQELNRGADGQAASFSLTEGTGRLKVPSSSRCKCIACPLRNGAAWRYERIIFVYFFRGPIMRQLEPPLVHLLAFAETISQKHQFLVLNDLGRLQARYAVNLFHRYLNAQSTAMNFLSSSRIRFNSIQIFCFNLSENVPRYIIECTIGPSTKSRNCPYSSGQMIYNVLKAVLNFLCFTSQTISIVDWDIDVLPSVTRETLST